MPEELILDRYRPISEAGSGGFATVRLAWDTRIQRRVAIKCMELEPDVVEHALYPDGSIDVALVPGIEEARTAAMLTDADIVGVYDFEVQGSMAYLIMEYVDGMTLSELLRTAGDDLDLDIVATVFSAVSHALEVAHDNQVLHLDIKPDNILINRQGQVKVTDFGLARLSNAAGFGRATGGTIGYMPPEQMRLEQLDARCDEWALASIVYEMFSGQNPFFADNLDHAEQAIYDAEIILPHLCMPDLDPQADDVIFYALDPDRDGRYDSVTDFAEELEKFLGNPGRGRKKLAHIVGVACEDMEDETDEVVTEYVRVFEGFSPRTIRAFGRVWSALSVGVLSFVSLVNVPQVGGWDTPLFWGVLAVFVAVAAIFPSVGIGLAVIGFSVALILNNAPIVGGVLIAATVAWFVFAGRRSMAEGCCAIMPVTLGAFGFAQATPLAAGYFSPLRPALVTTGFGVLLNLSLASLGAKTLIGWNAFSFWHIGATDIQANMLMLITQPETWCLIAGWVVAAAVVSVCCKRGTTGLAILGVVLGFVALAGSQCLGAFFASNMTSWLPDVLELVPTICALILVALFTMLGIPDHTSDHREYRAE